MKPRIILLQVQAPPKPPPGQPCNGCGVCCATEPCPVGVLLTRRTQGACVALRWDSTAHNYRCAVVAYRWPALPRAGAGALQKLARRWISAGSGCDCSLQVQAGP